MEKRAISKYRRISAFKARDITRLIQGKSIDEALRMLAFAPQKAARLVEKTLRSAIANYEQAVDGDVDRSTLLVKEALIGEGPSMKRIRPKARRMAGRIIKRSSHIRITVWDGEQAKDLVADYFDDDEEETLAGDENAETEASVADDDQENEG